MESEGSIAAFSGNHSYIEAQRPRRKLFEPAGRVFAAAAKQDLEWSENVDAPEGFLLTPCPANAS
jgi:hypothetical protein